ncbi:DUF4358 domain-containing protein [uncultured Oscillibacter sp.]|uniref:DUF4358 domain-containing protein n=1 Tax=uncultured Oscillibacter sp. TaxID=876091 RepID=UPI0026193800|nr:DUF4358 domain-containing protein [uncultured Oscillibacter sp.]
MKKWMTLTLTLFSLLALPACGGQAEPKNVDLTEVYASMEEVCDWWTGGYMEDVPEEALELYYPGLSALEPVQLIARTPLMSSVVNEVVLVECKSEEDADKAQEILQARIDYQVGDDTNPGGVWYPESIEQWKKTTVQRQGNYLALLAVTDTQSQLADIFNQAFA